MPKPRAAGERWLRFSRLSGQPYAVEKEASHEKPGKYPQCRAAHGVPLLHKSENGDQEGGLREEEANQPLEHFMLARFHLLGKAHFHLFHLKA